MYKYLAKDFKENKVNQKKKKAVNAKKKVQENIKYT